MITSDIKRIFTRPLLYVAIVVGVIILNRPLIEALVSGSLGSGSLSQVLSVPFAMSDFTPFAAIFCSLPFSDSFCEDYNTGYIRSIVSRSGVRKYAIVRDVSVAISGGFSMFIIILITILFCGVLSDLPETPDKVEFMRNSIWVRSGIIYIAHGYPYLAIRLLFAFLFGSVWSLVGLTISTIFTNRYVTYIAPFVIYQSLWFVFDEEKWNPVYLLRCDSNFIPSLGFVIVYQFTIILFLSIISCFLIRKKVKV